MRAKSIEAILDALGLRVVQVKDYHHQHFLARDHDGNLYLVIITNRTLRNPKAVSIPFDGEMFGIRKSYVDYELLQLVDKVLWIYRGDAYLADAAKVRKFVYKAFPGIDTCVKRGYEVICHYPIKLCKKMTVNIGLNRFLRVTRYAGH